MLSQCAQPSLSPDLDTLVKGVALSGTARGKYKFLHRIPVDPMTGTKDWGLRSMQDEPDSPSWGGQNVFDVLAKSAGKANKFWMEPIMLTGKNHRRLAVPPRLTRTTRPTSSGVSGGDSGDLGDFIPEGETCFTRDHTLNNRRIS